MAQPGQQPLGWLDNEIEYDYIIIRNGGQLSCGFSYNGDVSYCRNDFTPYDSGWKMQRSQLKTPLVRHNAICYDFVIAPFYTCDVSETFRANTRPPGAGSYSGKRDSPRLARRDPGQGSHLHMQVRNHLGTRYGGEYWFVGEGISVGV